MHSAAKGGALRVIGSGRSGSAVQEQYSLVALEYGEPESRLGSVFTSVTTALLRRGHWRRKRQMVGRVDMLFGTALGRGIPYHRLPRMALDSSGGMVVNYFRNFREICRKAKQVCILRAYCTQMRIPFSRLCPESFVFYPAEPKKSRKELANFVHAFNRAAAARTHRNVWILKPSEGGKGERIEVMDDGNAILDFLCALPPKGLPWVIQKYIEQPLLLQGGRKFDIRCWVVVTADFRVLLYRSGVLRTGSVRYSLSDLSDRFVHLSNHCIQEQHPAYGQYEPTNEMFYPAFDAFLVSAFPDSSVSVAATLLPQVRDIIRHVFAAGSSALLEDARAGFRCFQLFGFDFMMDQDCRVYLIEINSSPAVAADLLPRLTEDLIDEVISPIFPPSPPPPPRPAAAGRTPARAAGHRSRPSSGVTGQLMGAPYAAAAAAAAAPARAPHAAATAGSARAAVSSAAFTTAATSTAATASASMAATSPRRSGAAVDAADASAPAAAAADAAADPAAWLGPGGFEYVCDVTPPTPRVQARRTAGE